MRAVVCYCMSLHERGARTTVHECYRSNFFSRISKTAMRKRGNEKGLLKKVVRKAPCVFQLPISIGSLDNAALGKARVL
jgi:hypothetical protein